MPPVPEIMLTLLQTIHQDLQEVKSNQNKMRDKLSAHIETEPADWAKVLADMMIKAFPNGDPEGHRHDHETRMRIAEEKAEFWKKMTYELKKWGLIGFILWAIKTLVEAGAIWISAGGHIK